MQVSPCDAGLFLVKYVINDKMQAEIVSNSLKNICILV